MKVKTPEAGGVAESLYGRDEGRLYIIVGREGERLLLADGKYKSCFAPKKKNAKHVRLLPKFFPEIAERIGEGKDQDSEIRAALKAAARERIKNQSGGSHSCPKTT